MFEMYDSLHDYFMAGEVPGTPVSPIVESVKPQGPVDKIPASTVSNSHAKPFPLKKVLKTASAIVLGYLLFEALIPRNNTSYTFSERRRLARQGASK